MNRGRADVSAEEVACRRGGACIRHAEGYGPRAGDRQASIAAKGRRWPCAGVWRPRGPQVGAGDSGAADGERAAFRGVADAAVIVSVYNIARPRRGPRRVRPKLNTVRLAATGRIPPRTGSCAGALGRPAPPPCPAWAHGGFAHSSDPPMIRRKRTTGIGPALLSRKEPSHVAQHLHVVPRARVRP